MQARYLVKSADIPQIQMILPRDGMQHMHLVVALGRLGCRGNNTNVHSSTRFTARYL